MAELTIIDTDPLVLSIEFNEPEAKGKIFLEEGPYGLYISFDPNQSNAIALVDLFYGSKEGKGNEPYDKQLIIYDNLADESVAYIHEMDGRTYITIDPVCEELDRWKFAADLIEEPSE